MYGFNTYYVMTEEEKNVRDPDRQLNTITPEGYKKIIKSFDTGYITSLAITTVGLIGAAIGLEKLINQEHIEFATVLAKSGGWTAAAGFVASEYFKINKILNTHL
jgi:hypothetical protein